MIVNKCFCRSDNRGLGPEYACGYARLSAWADLLDRINVYPVADGDTGTNLRLTLAPLRCEAQPVGQVAQQLIYGARGNSGNIAAAFFSAMVQARETEELANAVQEGYLRAKKVIAHPQSGTMLDILDALTRILSGFSGDWTQGPALLAGLQETVRTTPSRLPDLDVAGVVDAGALGLYLFFEGYFHCLLASGATAMEPLESLFPGQLQIAPAFVGKSESLYCVDAVLHADQDVSNTDLSLLGESVVLIPEGENVKIHIHTEAPEELRGNLSRFGQVTYWQDDRISQKASPESLRRSVAERVHIMTDATASLPPEIIQTYGISLLDSYVVGNDTSLPESLCSPENIYPLLLAGKKLTTSQASVAERQQRYQSVCEQYGPTVYICVGSVYTGNYETACQWQRTVPPESFSVVDSGATSGRLGLLVMATARYARTAENVQAVIRYATEINSLCHECIFIDSLRYIARSGRMSRSLSLVGDLLNRKPIVSTLPDGTKKLGVVSNSRAQVAFACQALSKVQARQTVELVLLQYSDNKSWVESEVLPQLRSLVPAAEWHLIPLSLTSGVHMGPGTWSLAFK